MNRTTLWIRVHLAIGVTLAVAAAVTPMIVGACDACTLRSALVLPIAGAAFYAGLLALALVRGPGPLLACGIFAAVAVHGLLVGEMASTASWCVLCTIAAANSLVLAALAVAHDTQNLTRAAIVIPVAAAASAAFMPLWGARLVAPEGLALARSTAVFPDAMPDKRVRITIYEKDDCPYCNELRATVAPQLVREFGSAVSVGYRHAADLPGIRMTPTVVITRPDESGGRIIEGLPPYSILRAAVLEAMKP